MPDGPIGIDSNPGDLIALRFDRKTFKLDIDGNVRECAVAITMLDQAKRFFEMQERLGTAQQLQSDQKRTADVLGRIKL